MLKTVGALFAGAQVIGFFKDSLDEAAEAAKIGRLTDAVIKSTGGSAHVTADQVGDLANRLSELAGIDDEVIQGAENVLLTFTKVRNETGKGNDIFNQATAAALDLSVALGTDLQSATILVGKALNDPIKGVTALRKSGVQLTEAQTAQVKKMVEAGNVMGAQKVILAELASEFGGAAAAAASPADKAKVAWKNFEEYIGGIFLPIVGKVADWFTQKAAPAIKETVDLFIYGWTEGTDKASGFVQQFGGIAGYWFTKIKNILANDVFPVLKDIVLTIRDFIGWVNKGSTGAQWFRAAIVAITAAWAAYKAVSETVEAVTKAVAAAQWLLNIAMDANPIGLILLAIVGLVAGFAYLWTHSESFRKFWINLWGDIWGFLKAVGAWFAGPFANFFVGLWHGIETGLRKIGEFFTFYWNLARAIVTAVVLDIQSKVDAAIAFIVGVCLKIHDIVEIIRSAFERARSAVVDRVSAVIEYVKAMPGRFVAALGSLGSTLYNAGADLIRGLWAGIQSLGGWLADKVGAFIDRYVPGPVKRLLGIASPSKLFAGFGRNTVQGFAEGFMDRARQLAGQLSLPLPGQPTIGAAGAAAAQAQTLAAVQAAITARGAAGDDEAVQLLRQLVDLIKSLRLTVGPTGIALAARAGEKQLDYAGGGAR